MSRSRAAKAASLAALSVSMLVGASSDCGGKVVADQDATRGVDGASTGATSGSSDGRPETTSGQGAGPVPSDGCPRVADAVCNGASWGWVFSILEDKGGCASPACHGEQATAALGVYLPSTDVVQFFDTLFTFEDAEGRPYVNRDDPKSSWMPCHVADHRPDLADSDLSVIDDWLGCGALGPE